MCLHVFSPLSAHLYYVLLKKAGKPGNKTDILVRELGTTIIKSDEDMTEQT